MQQNARPANRLFTSRQCTVRAARIPRASVQCAENRCSIPQITNSHMPERARKQAAGRLAGRTGWQAALLYNKAKGQSPYGSNLDVRES